MRCPCASGYERRLGCTWRSRVVVSADFRSTAPTGASSSRSRARRGLFRRSDRHHAHRQSVVDDNQPARRRQAPRRGNRPGRRPTAVRRPWPRAPTTAMPRVTHGRIQGEGPWLGSVRRSRSHVRSRRRGRPPQVAEWCGTPRREGGPTSGRGARGAISLPRFRARHCIRASPQLATMARSVPVYRENRPPMARFVPQHP